MSEQQNGFSRMNNVNHSGGTNRPSSGPARSEGSASRRFSNIPLARKIEALILAVVTVIASASVDWSSLTARAEGEYQNKLSTDYHGTITTTGESIAITVTGDGHVSEENTSTPYMTLLAAYTNWRVTGGSAHFYVDVYQFPSTAGDYKDAAAVKNGGTPNHIYQDTIDRTSFLPTLILSQSSFPVYLDNGEHATIVVTFDELNDGATVEYGQDSEGNGIEVEPGYSATCEDVTLTSDVDKYVLTIGTDTSYTYDGKFHITPAYQRSIYYHLYKRTPKTFEALEETAKNADSTFSDSGTDQVQINTTTGELSAKNANGVNTLVASTSTSSAKWLKIPIYVVDPGVVQNGTNIYNGRTYDGTAVPEPQVTCTNGPTLTSETNYTVRFTGTDRLNNIYSGNAASAIKNAGDYTVTISGSGDYEGLYYTQTFEIAQKNLTSLSAPTANMLTINPNDLSVSSDAGTLTDTVDGKSYTLVCGKDYSAKVTRSSTGGQYDVALTGMGNYTGTATTTTNLSSNTEDNPGDLSAMVSSMQILDNTTSDAPIYDYDAQGHKNLSFIFKDLNGAQLNLQLHTDYEYTITSKATNQDVYYSETALASGYDGAISAGDYLVTVRGKGAYSGNVTSDEMGQTFRINPRTLTKNNIKVKMNPTTLNYTGDVCFPTTVTLQYRNGSDYYNMTSADFDAEPADASKAPGTHAVKITGKGNFTGEVDFSNSTKAEAKTSAQSDADYAAYLDANENLVLRESIVTYDIVSNLDSAQVYLADDANSFGTTYADAGNSWESGYTTVYDGQPKKPAVKVVLDGKELKQRTISGNTTNDPTADYRVIYPTADNIKAGTATLKIKGMNTFANAADIDVTFTITPKPLTALANDAFTISGTQTYGMKNGKIKLPADPITLSSTDAVLKDGENTLDVSSSATGDGDYYLTYENNTDASSNAVVIAHGINNYSGEIRKTFTINPLEMTAAKGFAVAPINPQTFSGTEIKPDSEVKVTYANSTNGLEDAFTIAGYKNNINVGDTATVTVKGKGNFTGTLTGTFKIVNKSLIGVTYKLGGKTGTLNPITNSHYEVDYTGQVIELSPTLTDGLYQLKKGTDYTLTYGYDASQGEKAITITGSGNYEGTSAILKFTVNPVTLKNVRLVSVATSSSLDASKVLTTGTEIKRYYQVQLTNGTVLKPDFDYTFRWTTPKGTLLSTGVTPTEAGTGYTVEITGHNNYEGTIAITQDTDKHSLMVGASLSVDDVIGIVDATTVKGGGDINNPHSVKYLGANMPQVYLDPNYIKTTNNINNNIDGTISSLSGPTYTNGQYNNNTGDYRVYFVPADTTDDTYSTATKLTSLNAGDTFKVAVEAAPNSTKYFGWHLSGVIKVVPRDLSTFGNGGSAKGTLTVTDQNNTSAGSYKVTDGTKDTTNDKLSYEYTGGTITPNLKVVFKPTSQKSDVFTGSFVAIDLSAYSQSIDPATISADAIKSGNISVKAGAVGSDKATECFSGSLSVPYEIKAKEITADMVHLKKTSAVYDGTSHKEDIGPVVKFGSATLNPGEDYTVEYYSDESCSTKIPADSDSAFTNAGTIYVKIYKGSDSKYSVPDDGIKISTPFVITGEDISGATIELETKTKTPYYAEIYNGSEVKPTVKVTLGGTPLTENTDFKVDYANNTDIGAATVTITGQGNYTGTATQQFYIYASLKNATATGIKDGGTYVIKSKGKPEDDKGNIVDYTDVSFKVGNKTLEKDTNYSVTVTHNDGTAAKYGLAEPGKYIITYTGLGIDHYCDSDTSESVTYSVTILGDIKNFATISGYSSVYDYTGTKPYGPQNSKDIKIKLTGGYRVLPDAYTIVPNKNNTPSSEKNTQPYFTIKIADSYKDYYIADTGDTLDVPFAIKYNLQRATIKLKADEEAPVYGEGEDDVDELKDKIEVTYPGITGTLPTEAYQVTGAVWKTVGSSNKAQLVITISPDEGEVLSYNTRTKTIDGSWKSLGTPTIAGDTTAEYDNQDHYADFKSVISVSADDGATLSEGADYTVQFRKADSSGNYSATGTIDSKLHDAGKYYAEIKGLGAYHTDKPIVLKDAGQVFIVNPKNISTSTMDLVDKNVKYYSGADPEAQYTVTDTELNAVLKENTDYTIAHTETAPAGGNLWDVGTVITYTVTGTGNYTGTNTATVTIEAADLNANGVIDVQNDSIEYDGQPHGPEFKVYRGKTPLTEGVDYDIDSKNTSVNVGKYTYTITGKDHYTGSKTIDFSITPRDLSKATIKLTKKEYDWSGTPITPTDYTISDSAVTNSTILKDVAVSYVNNTNSYKYVDDNETDASAPAVVFTASGNYTGTVTKHFQIGSDIKDATVTLDDDSEPYSPTTPFRPNVKSITFNGTTYDANSTPALSGVATWSYATADGTPISSTSEPKNAGNYKVVVTGQGGPFFGSTDAEYTITSNPVSIADLDVQIKRDTNKAHGQHYDSASGDYYYYYTGEDIEPEVEVTYTSPDTGKAYTLTASSSEDDTSGDYYLTYDNNDQVGTATAIAHLHNNYESDSDLEGEAYFYIYARDISDYKVSVKGGKVRYTGYELEPDYIVTTDDRTYDSSVAADKAALDALGIEAKYTNNIAPGTGNIALTGSGNSTGTTKATATFIIYADLSSDVDYITPEEVFRTGKKLDPDITLHFVDKVDKTDHQIVESESKWFTSKCTLPQGKTWENADYINVSISHKADYLVRSRTDTITLSKVPTDLTIEGYYPTYQYTGAKVTPDLSKLTVKSGGQDLPSGATVSYSFSGSKDGTACIVPDQDVTITAKVTYGGQTVSTSHNKYSTKEKEKFAKFRIVKRPIKACTFQGPSDARYTGSAVAPIFSINTGYTQLRYGTDYNYTVRNNVKPGNAIVTIKGQGNYVGTTTKVFHIYVAPVTGLTSSGRSGTTAVIRWNRSGTADGYRVTYTSTRGVRKMLITSGTANNYKLTDLGAGSTQVLVEAYVAGSSGQPIAYSAPESIYVR